MAHGLNKLHAKQVSKLVSAGKAGRYSDGGGLYLHIRDGKAAHSWIYIWVKHNRRREMKLAPLKGTSLAKARAMAAEARAQILQGLDPIQERKRDAEPNFKTMALQYIADHEKGWKSDKHKRQWYQTLEVYLKPLHNRLPSTITNQDVLKVLRPIWNEKPETARRVRMRCEAFLGVAIASGHMSGPNPATWRGNLDLFLSKKRPASKAVVHHAALDYREAPEFMTELRQRSAYAALVLEFLILTAARSKEVRHAPKSEFNFDAEGGPLWTIPAARMKANKPHRVPLSPRAAASAAECIKLSPNPYAFPSPSSGELLSVNATRALLIRMNYGHVTTHGFRSTFRDWAGDRTSFNRELIEQALAHQISDKSEAAYRRGDALEKRRGLMNLWGQYLEGGSAEVIPIRSGT